MQYWLLKSEPDTFSIDDLKRKGVEPWDGVRNYQARNMMRDEMKKGDLALFYHSSCKEPGVVGVMTVAKGAYADNSAQNPESPYYDPKSTHDEPRWFMVDMQFKRKTKHLISLEKLKQQSRLADCPLVKRGNRLSIMPLTKHQWDSILSLE